MKLTVPTDQGPMEVDAVGVSGTGDLFAVCRDEDQALGWALVHVPTGYFVGMFAAATDARNVARQLYAVAPQACALSDPGAFVPALPAGVAKWVSLVQRAQPVPPALLKTCAEYLAVRSRPDNGEPDR
jgi:hypothetical protein